MTAVEKFWDCHGTSDESRCQRCALCACFYEKEQTLHRVLNVICKEEDIETLQNIIFEETTTIGIRYSIMERTILPRETRTLPTPWGEVQVKVCTLNGKEQLYPEYESVAQLSREKEIPFAEIYRYIVLANKEK